MNNATLPSDIWHLYGKDQDGPNVMILGGTHGSELTGIQIVRAWLNQIDPDRDLLTMKPGSYQVDGIRGNLYIGFGNPEAIKQGLRGTKSGQRDLNRCFDPELLASEQTWVDLERARELWPLLQEIDYLFDIHAVSSNKGENDPFVCFGEMTPEHERLCHIIPVIRVLTDPHNMLGVPENSRCLPTTDEAVNGHGGGPWSVEHFGRKRGVAICYETGYEGDEEKIPLAKLVILDLLRAINFLDESLYGRLEPVGELADEARAYIESFKKDSQHAYALSHCEIAKDDSYRHREGLENWMAVSEGDVAGHYADGTPVHVPHDGWICFLKGEAKIKKDDSLFYIATRLY